jgi:hypothetical protein
MADGKWRGVRLICTRCNPNWHRSIESDVDLGGAIESARAKVRSSAAGRARSGSSRLHACVRKIMYLLMPHMDTNSASESITWTSRYPELIVDFQGEEILQLAVLLSSTYPMVSGQLLPMAHQALCRLLKSTLRTLIIEKLSMSIRVVVQVRNDHQAHLRNNTWT